MARREWADKLVERYSFYANATDREFVISLAASLLLRKEHARAVRIVKRAKRLELHGLRDTDTNEFLEGYEAACVDILSALTKRRA